MADLENLKTIRNSKDTMAILNEIERIGKSSEEFAARRMNQGIRKALSGQNVEDLKDF